ncbi:MAG: DUF4355 domain-containing protein [bacterium]|nr:DUF4355 domain-containing protein [bacterium]
MGETGTVAQSGTGGIQGTAGGAQSGVQSAAGAIQNGTQNTGNGAQNGAQSAQNAQAFNYNDPEFQRFVQSAVDRATQKLGTENKDLRTQIEQLQTANMTDAQKHEHDMTEREKALKAGEAALKVERNKMYAMGAIKKAGLDDGTDTALSLIDLVMADEEKDIDTRVESLNTLVKKLVAAEVNKTFAANGRQPGKSNVSDSMPDKNAAAINAGKRAAAANKASRGILDYYVGGNK